MHALKILSIEWKLFSYNSILHSPDISTNLIPKKNIKNRSLINAFPWLLIRLHRDRFDCERQYIPDSLQIFVDIWPFSSLQLIRPLCRNFLTILQHKMMQSIRTGRISELTVAHFSIPSGRRAASMIPQHFNRFQP